MPLIKTVFQIMYIELSIMLNTENGGFSSFKADVRGI